MKGLLKTYFIFLIILYFTPQFVSGMIFKQGMETILITAFALTISFLLIKPVISLLLLPINLLSFGLLRWVSSAVTLYLVTLIISDFKIEKFSFHGLSSEWIDIPSLNFDGVLAFIAFSFLISFIYSLIHWVVK